MQPATMAQNGALAVEFAMSQRPSGVTATCPFSACRGATGRRPSIGTVATLPAASNSPESDAVSFDRLEPK